jgi:hypothetical protein
MRVEGRSPSEIGVELGVERRTVYLWFGDPLVKAELGRQIRLINEAFVEKLASASLAAVEQLTSIVEQPVSDPVTNDTKLKAIHEILERSSWRSGSARDSAPAGTAAFIQSLSKEQLIHVLQSLGRTVAATDTAQAPNGNGRPRS